ncbi:hypothetical protein [Streptantibioticus parmotrematis]|uniref:hypothetical protein n=1 Tax=Streptantibioticus parmotrematis TaxID=2873249 RepID=UPI0027DF431A|nr:hypothetical protein [Streptantibioticus parmotrematis]
MASVATAALSTAALVSGGLLAATPSLAAAPAAHNPATAAHTTAPAAHKAASTAHTAATRASAPAATHSTPVTHSAVAVKHLCAQPTKPGEMACLAEARTDVVQRMSVAPNATPSGYGPADLRSAYNLPSGSAGAGQTVAIVDAQDDPNAEADLAAYRAQYGLPACTTANGCFHKVDQNGGTDYPVADAGWAGEISLDLDMVSATCPQCSILLVEANSPSMDDLGTAVDRAVTMGAKYVSNSYGGYEDPSEVKSDLAYFDHPGVAITASAGDDAYGAQYPAASPFVTSVGGTALSHATNSRGWSESVWSTSAAEGTGSGCSADEAKPSWQKDTGCSHRTISDVSAVADPATGVAVYDSYQASGWDVYGGTSASSPIIASVYALAGAPAAGTVPASYPYADTAALNDVTTGSNGSCSPGYLCTAGTGYDGPTGLGTPNGTAAFTAPAGNGTTLASGQELLAGQSLSNAAMTLTMQTDGNLVAYLKTGASGNGPAVWSSHTNGNAGAYAIMQMDGNFVVYKKGGGPATGGALWSSGTYGHGGAYASLQSDGNLVVYKGSSALWSSGTWRRSQTIASNTKMTAGWWTQSTTTRLVMQADGNLVLYRDSDGVALWSAKSNGNAGAYAYMQSDGNFVVYKSTGAPGKGGALWSSGTYGNSGAYAVAQNDGNLVVYKKGGSATAGGQLWTTGTSGKV